MLQTLTPTDKSGNHSRKPHNSKHAQGDGVLLQKRDGQIAYFEYAAHFGVTYHPGLDNRLEQIQCRMGDSCFTVEGRNLWPLFEDLRDKQCESIQESQPPSQAAIGVPYIERITVRLWL